MLAHRFEAANTVGLAKEKPKKEEIQRYANVRKRQMVYAAASRLWEKGVEIDRALKIVRGALS